jgi:hypothetical protein
MSDGEAWTPHVFVSYAHDNTHHRHDVLLLCELLRRNGMDAWVDEYDSHQRQDWFTWMTGQIIGCDYILAIASPGYREAADGRGASDRHRGVQAESALIRELYYKDRRRWLPRVLPVVLPGRSIDEIPDYLQPTTASHYLISELSFAGIERLLRVLTRQPAFVPTGIGNLPPLPPEQIAGDEAGGRPEQATTVRMSARASGHGQVNQAGRDLHVTDR